MSLRRTAVERVRSRLAPNYQAFYDLGVWFEANDPTEGHFPSLKEARAFKREARALGLRVKAIEHHDGNLDIEVRDLESVPFYYRIEDGDIFRYAERHWAELLEPEVAALLRRYDVADALEAMGIQDLEE
jgi:hypothetical protein